MIIIIVRIHRVLLPFNVKVRLPVVSSCVLAWLFRARLCAFVSSARAPFNPLRGSTLSLVSPSQLRLRYLWGRRSTCLDRRACIDGLVNACNYLFVPNDVSLALRLARFR